MYIYTRMNPYINHHVQTNIFGQIFRKQLLGYSLKGTRMFSLILSYTVPSGWNQNQKNIGTVPN